MRPARALALMALLGIVGAWTTSGPPPPAPFQLHAVPPLLGPPSQTPTTTTTVAARIVSPPRIRPIRASRGVPRPVVAETAPGAYSGPTDQADCGMWGYKTRARSDECWGPIIAAYGDWPTATMLRILYCESKGNPWVVNSSNHVGLLQIKNSNTKGDGPGNIAHAHAMWVASGTRPWAQCGG